MEILGTKIYYCLLTGDVLEIIGDRRGNIRETSLDEDYKMYPALNERDKSTIGLLTFEFGEYPELSKMSSGVRIDLDEKKPIFSYDGPIEQKSISLDNPLSELLFGLM